MLELSGVRKSFGKTVAVDGLTLRVREGEIFGLLGPNGAGKTTTISIAVGLRRADGGAVSVGGLGEPTSPAARAKVGLAPQSIALYPELTARENLSFFASLYGLGGRASARRVGALLALVGLEGRAGDRVGGFSGGMKRRLNLAAALVHEPAMVMLDEPTAGVDPQSRNAILDLVRGLRDGGTTVLYTTHYMEEAQRLCDRVGIMDRGRLLALGTVDELITAYGGRSVLRVERDAGVERIETDAPMRDLAPLLDDGTVLGVRVERADLEAVFLSLTGRSLRD